MSARPKGEFCEVCSNVVRVMSYKGTGVCSETCRKKRDGEPSATQRWRNAKHSA